jgi:hypothetical protein
MVYQRSQLVIIASKFVVSDKRADILIANEIVSLIPLFGK